MKTPLIKWTGSKRSIASKIVSHFPKEIETYYEPFIGGGSVFFELLRSSNNVTRFRLSDINESLIEIYNLVKDSPEILIEHYTENWKLLKENPEHFYKIRDFYNSSKCPKAFYFLTRTCYNGTIRYNQKGEFNTSHHFGRDGMNPEMIKSIILDYNNLMSWRDVEFLHTSYESVIPNNQGDVVYLDPPYTNTKSLYFGNIDFQKFQEWIDSMDCSWYMNLNGVNVKDNQEVLNVKYDKKILLKSGNSSFSRMKGNSVDVQEYFYIKRV